jgi:very-short-patch-repair endonuclease
MLRFWNDDILRNIDGVLTVVLDAAQKAEPSPNPLPPVGEGY